MELDELEHIVSQMVRKEILKLNEKVPVKGIERTYGDSLTATMKGKTELWDFVYDEIDENGDKSRSDCLLRIIRQYRKWKPLHKEET
jgi:hypothetical protein